MICIFSPFQGTLGWLWRLNPWPLQRKHGTTHKGTTSNHQGLAKKTQRAGQGLSYVHMNVIPGYGTCLKKTSEPGLTTSQFHAVEGLLRTACTNLTKPPHNLFRVENIQGPFVFRSIGSLVGRPDALYGRNPCHARRGVAWQAGDGRQGRFFFHLRRAWVPVSGTVAFHGFTFFPRYSGSRIDATGSEESPQA